MSAENKNIENLFSSEFKDYRHDLDIDGAWGAVESALKEKKKRRFFWWFWPIGAIAIAAIAFFVLNHNNDTNKLAEAATQTENLPTTPTQLSDDHTRSMNTSDKNVVRPQAKDALISNSTTTTSASTVKSDEVLEKIADSESSETTFKSNEEINETFAVNRDEKKVGLNSSANELAKGEGRLNAVSENEQNENSLNEFLLINKNVSAQKRIADAIVPIAIVTNADVINAVNANGTSIAIVKNNSSPENDNISDQVTALSKMMLLPISLFPNTNKLSDLKRVNENRIELTDKNNRNRFLIELSGGAINNFVNTSLNTAADNADIKYLMRWNQTQQSLGGYQVGFKVGANIWKRLELSTGINFQKVINKIEWRQLTSTTHRVVWDDEAFFSIDDQGVSTSSGGQVIETESRFRYVKAKQIHNYINIPIQLGYSKLLGRYSGGVHVGPVINLSHKFQGRILDASLDIRSLTTDKYDEVYRTAVGLSGLADLRLGRSVGKSSEIFTSISYQYNGSNVFRNDFDIKMTNHNLSINVGWRQLIN